MIDRRKQLLHVFCCVILSKGLVSLGSNFVEKLVTWNVLHDEVDIFGVIVGLVVLDNVRMVKSVQDSNLLHNAVDVLLQLDFV